MTPSDSEFMRTFTQIVIGLALFTVLLIGFAFTLHAQLADPRNEARERTIAAQIAPIAGVYAGETGRAAQAAAMEAARAALASKVAFEGSLDPVLIYTNVCQACHDSGAGGSPKLEKAVWEPRLAQGLETLIKHAIEGYQGQAGIMPARGGRPDLSDEQVKVSVEYMIRTAGL